MKIIVMVPPAIEPDSLLRVTAICEEHKQHFEIEGVSDELFSISSPEHDMLVEKYLHQRGEQILYDKCTGCVSVRNAQMPPTRWPEGAEL